MRAIRVCCLLWLCSLPPGLMAQAGAANPVELVRTTGNEVMEDMRANETLYTNDRQKLIAMVETRVLPHFDFTVMTRLALGKYWASASEDQRAALIREFRTLLVRTYTNTLFAYRNEGTEVKPQQTASQDDVTIEVVVKRSVGKPVSLVFRMRKTGVNWKVIDVTVEGVSLIVNYRNSFSREIAQSGIDGLLRSLIRKNQSPPEEPVSP